MKRYLLFSLLFVSLSPTYGQHNYQLLYTGDVCVEVLLTEASNGDVMLVADSYSDTAAIFHRIYVQRKDAMGNTLQTTAISKGGSSYRLSRVHGTADNGLLIIGTDAPPLSDEDSVFVVKLDNTGTTSWSKGFQFDTNIHEVSGVNETSDGGFIVYGTYETSAVFSSIIFLVKLDASGGFVWSRSIKSQNPGAFHLVGGISEASNGDLWLSGSTRLNTEGSWLAKLNGSGETQSTTFFDTHNLTDNQPEPFALFERSNGEMDIFYNRTSFLDRSVLLNLRVDANGSPTMARRYYVNHTNGGGIDFVRPTGIDGYWLAGTHYPGSGFRGNGLAMEIGASANVIWANDYGTDYIEILTSMAPASDGGIFMAGFADPDSIIISPSENGLFPWLVKTDNNGLTDCFDYPLAITTSDTTVSSNPYQLDNTAGPGIADVFFTNYPVNVFSDTIVCVPTTIEEIPQTAFRLFPNPGKGRQILEMSSPIAKGTLTIVDTRGKIVARQEVLQQQNISIEFNGPTGIYFLTLTTENGTRLTSKLIKY